MFVTSELNLIVNNGKINCWPRQIDDYGNDQKRWWRNGRINCWQRKLTMVTIRNVEGEKMPHL